MATTGRASVEIVADLTGFAAQLRRDINRALRTVRVDTRTLARTILRDLSRHLSGTHIAVRGVRITLTGVRITTDQIEKALSGIHITITGIFINLTGVHINGDEVGKELGDGINRGAGRSLAGFGAVLAKAVAGAALKSVFAAIAVQALALAAAIAPAAGAIALLPAIIIAAVAVIGLLKAALAGFGDALKAAIGGDLEAFNEALEKLSPAAQGVAREFFRLGPAIKTFQQSLQDNFFAHLTGQIEATGNALLGLSKSTAFIHITSLFGQAAARALEFGRSAETLTRLGGILENVAASVAPLTGALTPLLDAFLTIASVGAGFFPGLTGGATDAANAFAKWAKAAEASGELQQIISGALSVLGDLAAVAGNVGSALMSVFSAGSEAGGGILETLKEVTGAVADFLASAEGQNALKTIFEVTGQVVRALVPIIGIVGSAIADIAPSAAGLVRAMLPLLDVVVGLAKELLPAFADVIGRVVTAATPLIGTFTTLATTVLEALKPLLPVIADAFAQIAEAVGGALAQVLPLIVEALTGLLAAVVPLIPSIIALALAFLPLLTPIVQLATFALPDLIALIGLLAAPIGAVAGMLAGLAGWLTQNKVFVEGLSRTIAWLALAYLAVLAGMKIYAITMAIVNAATTAYAFITSGAAIKTTALSVAQRIAAIAANAWAVAQWLLNIALTANPIGLIVVAIVALVAAFVLAYRHSATFRAIVQAAMKGIADAAIWLWENGIKPLWEGIKIAFDAIVAAALWLWNNGIKPTFDAISAVFAFVANIVKSFAALWWWLASGVFGVVVDAIKGYLNLLGAVFTWLYDVAIKPVIDAIAAGWNWLYANAIGPVIENFKAGLTVLGAVFAWLYANAIKPAIDNAVAVFNWLWNTATSIFDNVMGKVRAVGDVFRDVFSAIGGFIAGAFNTAVDIVKGAINSIIGVINGMLGSINEVLTTARNNVPGFTIGNIPQIPRLAQGGIAEAGRTHLVGERGPELFVPDRTGTVIPNNALGGPQVIENHIHIGDEVVRVVRTQIDGANRDLRRRVLAGAGAR